MRTPATRLTIPRALRFTIRDLRGAPSRTLALVFALAVAAAAAYSTVAYLSAFRLFLMESSRQWFAADLQVILNHLPEPEDLQALPQESADLTIAIETQVLARAPATGLSAPVTLKAVDPQAYPFYGRLELRPPAPLSEALFGNQVAVNPELLTALAIQAGDDIDINGHRFRTSALIHREPDRFASFPYTFQRVLMSRASLELSGVMRLGNNFGCRMLFRLHDAARLEEARAALDARFPDSDLADYRHPDPASIRTLDMASWYLGVCLVGALLMALLAAGLLLHVYLDERLDQFAILKVVGATTRTLAMLAAVHTGVLVLIAVAAGVAVGEFVVRLTVPALENWFRMELPPHPWAPPLAAASGACALAGCFLCMYQVSAALRVRPLRLLRRHVEAGVRLPFLAPGVYAVSTFCALLAATTLLTLAAVLELGVAPSLTRALPVPRASLGLVSPTLPQLERILEWLPAQDGVELDSKYPLAWLRLLEVNGAPARTDRMWYVLCHEETSFPRGTARVSGANARKLGVRTGDTLTFQLPGRALRVQVSGIESSETLLQALVGVQVGCEDLRPEALLLAYAAFRVPPAALAGFRAAMARQFPTVVTITRDELTELTRDVIRQALLLVRAGLVAIASSCLLIMALMAAANARRRLPETAILRVLGASRRTLMLRYLRFYSLLGLAAGAAGGMAGAAAAALLIRSFVQQTPAAVTLVPALAAIPVTALVAVLAAWVATHRVLHQRPMDTLREP